MATAFFKDRSGPTLSHHGGEKGKCPARIGLRESSSAVTLQITKCHRPTHPRSRCSGAVANRSSENLKKIAAGPISSRTSRPPEQMDRAVDALLALAFDFAVAH